jgi:hypothetical protein
MVINSTINSFKSNLLVKTLILFFITLFFIGCSIGDKNNPNKKTLATNLNWTAFEENKICYLVSFPIKSVGSYQERNLYYTMIVFNKKQVKSPSQIIVFAGKNYKENSQIILNLDDIKYYLQNNISKAKINNKIEAEKIFTNMLKFKYYVVYQSFEDSSAEDTYSLDGLKESYNILNQKCK